MSQKEEDLARTAGENEAWLRGFKGVVDVGVGLVDGDELGIVIGVNEPLPPADEEAISKKLQGHKFQLFPRGQIWT